MAFYSAILFCSYMYKIFSSFLEIFYEIHLWIIPTSTSWIDCCGADRISHHANQVSTLLCETNFLIVFPYSMSFVLHFMHEERINFFFHSLVCLMETIQGLSNYELFLMKLQSYIVLCDEPNKKINTQPLNKRPQEWQWLYR